MNSLEIDSNEEEYYFYYSAALRIYGKNLDFELIKNTLGVWKRNEDEK
jgi:hypothetical protein